MHFTHAIVRTPCERITDGLTTADLGKPEYSLALKQHQEYVNALRFCGLNVEVLEADDNFPDSTFVEDTALLTKYIAVFTRPGAASRMGEVQQMQRVITAHYEHLFNIIEPGTLEAGDVMMMENHFFIGLSGRTNNEGASQLKEILETHGMSTSLVDVPAMLHLKSGISYLSNNIFLAVDPLRRHSAFLHRNVIPVPEHEAYAANSLWVNGFVLVPHGFPITLNNIKNAGFETIELDMSEFRKLDGGLSCLSLRF
jgi:dimethylargininase